METHVSQPCHGPIGMLLVSMMFLLMAFPAEDFKIEEFILMVGADIPISCGIFLGLDVVCVELCLGPTYFA